MKELTIDDGITELGVTTYDGEKAIVSSRKVAGVFGKRHSNVLRDIENQLQKCSEEFGELNFELSEYKGKSGRKNKEYSLTKDGCIFLIMGFTGKKAAKFKEEYIKQFNQMEELIKNRHFTKIEYEPMTDAIKEFREEQGKEPKWYHFSNEADMLNRIVIGKTAKKVRESNGLDKGVSIRDYIPEWQVEALKHLQRLNTDLLHSSLGYDNRKEIIQQRFNKMYNKLELKT
mgnify:CR=1 FL=1